MVHRPFEFEFPPDFADRLTRFKEASGLSWRAIARMLGVSASRLRQWRNKGVLPNLDHYCLLLLIAERMGLREILLCHEQDLPRGFDPRASIWMGRGDQATDRHHR